MIIMSCNEPGAPFLAPIIMSASVAGVQAMSLEQMWLGELIDARVTVEAAHELCRRGVISKEVLSQYLWIGCGM